MGLISFNEISLWDAFIILVFINGHLFEYEKQPIIRLKWLNTSPLLHTLSFKVVVSYAVERFFAFGCGFWLVLGGFLLLLFLVGEGRKLNKSGIKKYLRDTLFWGFVRTYTCARHHWIAVMFSIFPYCF